MGLSSVRSALRAEWKQLHVLCDALVDGAAIADDDVVVGWSGRVDTLFLLLFVTSSLS